MQIYDGTFIVDHCLCKSMVDGQVCNSVSANKSTQTCYTCKMTSAQFNKKIDSEPIPYDPATPDFGLSSLHIYIRFFECPTYILQITNKILASPW